MRVRILTHHDRLLHTHTNKNHKDYKYTGQILNIILLNVPLLSGHCMSERKSCPLHNKSDTLTFIFSQMQFLHWSLPSFANRNNTVSSFQYAVQTWNYTLVIISYMHIIFIGKKKVKWLSVELGLPEEQF